MKIAIVGYSGSGKSTLAKFLAERYLLPCLHLDRVNFIENWQERDRRKAIEIITEFMKSDSWVIDGNYSKLLFSERLEKADYIIFMNFNRLSCFIRTYKRFLKYRNKSAKAPPTDVRKNLILNSLHGFCTEDVQNHINKNMLKLYVVMQQKSRL